MHPIPNPPDEVAEKALKVYLGRKYPFLSQQSPENHSPTRNRTAQLTAVTMRLQAQTESVGFLAGFKAARELLGADVADAGG